MLEMTKIVANSLQPRQVFDGEKLQELANSIRESELLQPIVVRKNNGSNFEIVAGERRFRAFKILKEPRIPAIILNIKDDIDALLKSCVENLQRDDLTSVERENAIFQLWDSGRYKIQYDLSRKLGYSVGVVENLVNSYKARKSLATSENISTRTLMDTRGLQEEPRKRILESVSDGKIKADDVRDVVHKVKEFPEPEQQLEILEEFEKREDFSRDALNVIVEEKKRIADGIREPEWQPPKEENRWFLDDMQRDFDKIYSYGVGNLDGLPKIQRDESVEVLANALIYLMSQMVKMDEVERVRSIYEEKVNI